MGSVTGNGGLSIFNRVGLLNQLQSDCMSFLDLDSLNDDMTRNDNILNALKKVFFNPTTKQLPQAQQWDALNSNLAKERYWFSADWPSIIRAEKSLGTNFCSDRLRKVFDKAYSIKSDLVAPALTPEPLTTVVEEVIEPVLFNESLYNKAIALTSAPPFFEKSGFFKEDSTPEAALLAEVKAIAYNNSFVNIPASVPAGISAELPTDVPVSFSEALPKACSASDLVVGGLMLAGVIAISIMAYKVLSKTKPSSEEEVQKKSQEINLASSIAPRKVLVNSEATKPFNVKT